ncbi:glycosyltransferase [Chryseobacterium sp.]|uniref:glycosyltransferase n=1 Tax=Chryseobacterium sp. TaxID=1871047 RepID=UPI0012A8C42A|nr:glycosyltransferase [Chryseobacterium sp.]QFG53741.1 glycosyltransferase [Chryseobacterium sp.]
MAEKIKVAMICSFSNPMVRKHYKTKVNPVLRYILNKKGQSTNENVDSAVWNTNAIREFEKIEEVELHVITPVRYLSEKEVQFTINGVHYHFFRDENSGLFSQIYYQVFSKHKSLFPGNRSYIKKYIRKIQPHIVHVIGAENPQYSLGLLDVPEGIPTILQLQALLERLVNVTQVPLEKVSFAYKGKLERQLIQRADYIGTEVKEFQEYISREIKPDARFLSISIAMGKDIDLSETEKRYDFVYFAAGISKAGDDALKAFAIAQKKHPQISLHFVGGYDESFRNELDKIIEAHGLQENVTFAGRLPTLDDVILEIRKARYALLPLKMDFVPNTIREAMSNGLPVITTITEGGTTELNSEGETVLLSAQGDYGAMAVNIDRLLTEEGLADRLKTNAAKLEARQTNNYEMMLRWTEAYKRIKRDSK